MTDEQDKKPYNLYIRNGIFYVRLWDTEAGKYGTARSTKKSDKEAAEKEADKMLNKGKLKANIENPYFRDALLTYWKNREDLSTKYKTESIRVTVKLTSNFNHFSC